VPSEVSRILILGGTREARELAGYLEEDARYHVITSLAGRTAAPNEVTGEIRSGGFGGVEGLMEFTRKKRIALIVDATHPFAVQISANAADAGARTGIPCLRLERAPWAERKGDNWTHMTDIKAAARAIPQGARALVTVGRQEVAPFFARRDIRVLARMIEPPEFDVPDNAEVLLARPPFSLKRERALLEAKRIEVLVSKNSGGDATYTKIEAARALGLPVIMIARPDRASPAAASCVGEILSLIGRSLD